MFFLFLAGEENTLATKNVQFNEFVASLRQNHNNTYNKRNKVNKVCVRSKKKIYNPTQTRYHNHQQKQQQLTK